MLQKNVGEFVCVTECDDDSVRVAGTLFETRGSAEFGEK